jgi:phosphatidate cytidylyltransferase
MLAIVWAADVGAYAVGRSFGKNKLAPSVSPGKTWEGVVGGLCCAGVVGGLAGYVLGTTALLFAALAVVTAALSVVGDLNVSMFKRNAGLKDSGSLLPGHGGVLDRIDSVTAAVAIFVLGLALIGIIT